MDQGEARWAEVEAGQGRVGHLDGEVDDSVTGECFAVVNILQRLLAADVEGGLQLPAAGRRLRKGEKAVVVAATVVAVVAAAGAVT